ncbi:MAG: glycosyltransferase [Candidatus Aenigmarchaeota archaeon]|nr:glycosyltransferase [Candidatus Aenigmarchaeota archaeon]
MKEKILLIRSKVKDSKITCGPDRFGLELENGLRKKYDVETIQISKYHELFWLVPYLIIKSKAKLIISIHSDIWFTPFLSNKKAILTVHDLFPFTLSTPFYKNVLLKYLVKIFLFIIWRLSFYNNSFLVSNSSQTAKELKIFFGKESKIINHGVDINKFKSFKFKKLKQPIKLGFFSHFIYRKGIDIAINIYEKLKNKINCELILAGGKFKKTSTRIIDIEKLIKNDKNVKILGRIPDKDVPKLYNSFDFFLFPSRAEGFGLPILEAAACGIPVFTLKSAHIPEEVKKASIVCKDEDEIVEKIIELSKNKKLYDKIRFEKMKYARKFTWDKCVNEYDKLIQKCFLHK